MKFPGRSQRGPDPYRGSIVSGQISADESRHGVVDDGNVAWPERIAEARRSWTEARAEDFERTAKRRYIDRATGRAYKAVTGAPLLSVGSEANRGISTFFVANGNLTFLQPCDLPEELHGPTGHVYAYEVKPTPVDADALRIH